jgi:type IV pilus assembly protein PilP
MRAARRSEASPPPVPSELLGAETTGPVVDGASGKNPETASGVDEKAASTPQVPPPPSPPEVSSMKEEYTYDPTGRRDPFMIHKSFQKKGITSSGGKRIEQSIEILDPLIKIDLDKLEIVGIIWEVANPRALIIDPGDPEQKVHIVTKRTKIGRNNGYVAAIREGEIVVIETFEEAGIVNQQPKVIKLQTGK